MSRLPPAQVPRPVMSPVLGVTGPGVGYVPQVKFTWNDLPGKPGTFPPAAHSHAVSEVSGLQAALDGKQPAGSYVLTSNFNWGSLSGKPTTFTPSAHGHAIGEVTGLQAALDSKQAAGSYAVSSHTHSYLPLGGGTLTGNMFINVPWNYDGHIRMANTNRGWLVGMLGNPGATSFNIYDLTADATRFTIDTGGGVGIGTVPDSRLHVLGVGGTSGLRVGYGLEQSSNYYDANKHLFRTGAGSDRFVIDGTTINAPLMTCRFNDITTSRGTSGVVYLNDAQTRYLYFDSSKYHLPSAELSVNGVDILTTLGTKLDAASTQHVPGVKYFYSPGDPKTSINPALQVYSNNDPSSGAWMSFHRGQVYAVNMGLDTGNIFRIGGWSAPGSLMALDMSGNVTFLGGQTLNGNLSINKVGQQDLIMGGVPTLTRSGATGKLTIATNADNINLTPTGRATYNDGRLIRHADTSLTGGDITISTAAPSGGSDGDIWYKVA